MNELLRQLETSPLLSLPIALLAALILTPFVRLLAIRCNIIAKHDQRRKHAGIIPEWGGITIFLAALLTAILWIRPLFQEILPVESVARWIFPFFGCGLLIVLLGMTDDWREMSPKWKLLGQIAAAALLWLGGIRMPLAAQTLSLIATVFWVISLTNAMNLIDGVDGLSTGIGAIAAGTLLILSWQQSFWIALISAAMCGACLGFLYYNLPPARIFLGDTGAMLLGFWLAALIIIAAPKSGFSPNAFLPVLALGVPLLDTTWAIIRRVRAKQPVWRGDREHLHHRLLARGFSATKVLFVLYGVSLLLGAVAVALQNY